MQKLAREMTAMRSAAPAILVLFSPALAVPEEGDCPDSTGATCYNLCWTALDEFERFYGPVARGQAKDIWLKIHAHYRKWRWCEDGSADEATSRFKETLLAEHWEEAPQLFEIARKDERLFTWVLSGFGDLGDPRAYRRIADNATRRCPKDSVALCGRLKAAALAAAGQVGANRWEDKPVLGVVEEQEGTVQVRMLVHREATGWVPFPDPAPGMESLHKYADLPRNMRWTICFDGKKRGTLETGLTITESHARAGVHVPLQGQVVPFSATRSAEFSGWLRGAVRHPMALSPFGLCSDPDGWVRGKASPELAQKLVAAMRGMTHADVCDGDRKTIGWTPEVSEITLLKTYRSRAGEWLATLRAKPPDARCDDIGYVPAFSSQLFRVTVQGDVVWLGSGMAVVDAGDYDGDGKSEVLVKFARYNNDGYTLFYDGFSKRASYGWNYH